MFASRQPTLDGQPLRVMFDQSQPPITDLKDPRLPRLIELCQRMTVPQDHPFYADFRRLWAWGKLLEDVESGRKEIYRYMRGQPQQDQGIAEWLDVVADYLQRRNRAA